MSFSRSSSPVTAKFVLDVIKSSCESHMSREIAIIVCDAVNLKIVFYATCLPLSQLLSFFHVVSNPLAVATVTSGNCVALDGLFNPLLML